MAKTKNWILIKVQVPLFSNDHKAGVLVYNKDRSVMQELPMRNKKERDFLLSVLDGEPKGYFWAEFDGKGLIIKGIAPEQDW